MTKVLIVYESRTGNTEAMAQAVSEGAVSAEASVSLKKAAEATTRARHPISTVTAWKTTYAVRMAAALTPARIA